MQTLSLLAALGLGACHLYTGDAPPDAAGPTAPDAAVPDAGLTTTATVACMPDFGDVAIVACGFGPSLGVIAVEGDALYAVSAASSYYRVQQGVGVTPLYHSNTTQPGLATAVAGSVFADGAIYFPALVELGQSSASLGLVAIDADGHTMGEPRVVTTGEGTEPNAPLVTDGTRLYMASTISESGGGAYVGPVVQSTLAGPALVPSTQDAGSPLAVVDGTLYYLHDNALARVPLGGGASTELVAGLDASAWTDRAVSPTTAYVTLAADPFSIRQVNVTDHSSSVLVTLPVGGEVPIGPPHDLRYDAGALYFLRDLGTDYAQLVRLRVDSGPDAIPEVLLQGPGLGVPVFDTQALYAAYTRGGYDAPIEGVIARIPKPAPHARAIATAGSSK